MLSFFNRVLANGRKNIYKDAAPWGTQHPTGLRLFFFLFRPFAKTRLKKLNILWGVGINPPETHTDKLAYVN